MTVIAFDGLTLAADRLTTDGPLRRTTTKIERTSEGFLIAATGNTSMCRELREWFKAGAVVKDYPTNGRDASLLVITPDGEARYFWDGPAPVVIEDPFLAIGSGSDFATAAMHYGKSAREAVELACQYCTSCGMGIDVLALAAPRRKVFMAGEMKA